MQVFTKYAEIEYPASKRGIRGLVPTMGALHAGHISLVERCRAECDTVMVSVFVNPTQFNDPEDLRNYPRTPQQDLERLEKAGVDIVYMPEAGDVYPEPDTRRFDLGYLDTVMEGAHRPGHFNGVAQVVSRLFDILAPDRAYFGEKDFQQLAVIRKIVKDGGYDIEIVGCPIVREPDGLAMSSRNTLLTPENRKAAPVIYQALSSIRSNRGKTSVSEAKARAVAAIDATGVLRTEYLEVVDSATLEEIKNWSDAPSIRACVAVQAGKVRLIDNIEI